MNRRLEVQEFGKPLVLVESPIPVPPAGGAVVKVHFAGICYSDIHVHEGGFNLGGGKMINIGSHPLFKFPLVLGHEISGEVYSLGEDVDQDSLSIHVGDKVMVYPWLGCGTCGRCHVGQEHFCPKGTPHHMGTFQDGGYQMYVVVPRAKYVIKVPDNLTLDVAALLPCSGITAYNIVRKVAPVVQDFIAALGKADLLIVGAGGLGLWCIRTARAMLPKETRILVAEVDERKLHDAREAGADDTVLWDPADEVDEQVDKVKNLIPNGVHVAVDLVATETTTSAVFQTLIHGSLLVVSGLFGGALPLPLPRITLSCISIVGVKLGSPSDLTEFSRIVAAGEVIPPPLSHVSLPEAREVMDDLKHRRRQGRGVISYVNK